MPYELLEHAEEWAVVKWLVDVCEVRVELSLRQMMGRWNDGMRVGMRVGMIME